MFYITLGKGFQMTFPNGYTISVQFGPGNYCDNRYAKNKDGDFTEKPVEAPNGIYQSANAEVAAWHKDKGWYTFDKDGSNQVLGWQTPDQVAALIAEVAALP